MDGRIPTVIMRGGTSRALFFLADDLPPQGRERDHVLLRAMGSPDRRQIDGLGGATSSTSKVAIIAPGTAGADVEYTFAQVAIDRPSVDYRSNCGNISSAVGPFAIDQGLVTAQGDRTEVRILNTNTGRMIHADVPLRDGRFRADGPYSIDGVPGTGGEIVLTYLDPGGAVTGHLLPTGRTSDTLDVAGLGPVDASIVDATSLYVFVRLADLGLVGNEEPAALNARPDLLDQVESIRATTTVALGLADTVESAARLATTPRIVMVGSPILRGGEVPPDLSVLAVSMGRIHQTVPVTAAMCAAAAFRLPGTLVAEAAGADLSASGPIRIGHPMGGIDVAADVHRVGEVMEVRSVTSSRTARKLMEGHVYVGG